MQRRTAAFTLIELLVTVAIMALVMTALFATLQGTVQTHDEAEIEIASVRDGPRILDMIERDVRSMHVFNMKDGAVLKGSRQSPGGLRGDRIDFVCTTDSIRRVPDAKEGESSGIDLPSDVNEVGYRLRTSAISGDFMELWRREDLFVDEDPFEGGTYEKIHDRVTRFEITYVDRLGEKAEESTDWDMAEKKKLPGAIRIQLQLQASPELIGEASDLGLDDKKLYTYTRVIAFPQDESVALSVRPYLPTKITSRGAGGGGAGGKGGKGAKGGADGGGGLGDGTGGEGGGGDAAEAPSGGKSLMDLMNSGEFKNGMNSGKNGAMFSIDPNNPGLQLHPDSDGNLSESDQQKIESYIEEFRGRYGGGGRGGSGGRGGGSGSGGGGGSGGSRPGTGGGGRG